jgi:hypothetical protein
MMQVCASAIHLWDRRHQRVPMNDDGALHRWVIGCCTGNATSVPTSLMLPA